MRSTLGRLPRAGAGDAPEHRAGNEPRAARVVEVEEPADHLAGAVEARYGPEVHVHHLPGLAVDPQAAEGERDAAGRHVSVERRRVELLRPVRFRRLDIARSLAVLDRVIELDTFVYGSVVVVNGLHELLRVDAFELGRELLDRICGDLGHELDAVFGAEQLRHLRIEDLPRELPGLLQDLA